MPPTTALRALPWSDRLGYGSAIRLARGIIGYDGGEPVLYIRTPLGIGLGLCMIIEGNFRELLFLWKFAPARKSASGRSRTSRGEDRPEGCKQMFAVRGHPQFRISIHWCYKLSRTGA
jgi:hypothetical protein